MADAISLYDQASDLERLVYDWLAKRNIVFVFQSQLIGGFGQQMGDARVDFVLSDDRICLRVQGEYWHKQLATEGKDIVQRERLIAMGYKVVDLWTNDIFNRLDEAMRHALIGEEIPQ